MSKFFNKLVSENLITDWADVLDWIFDDMKFSKERNWNRGYTSCFTKRVKKLKYLSEKDKRVIYETIDYKSYPNQQNKSRKKRTPYIMITSGNSFAQDLIRHIRNGIAHGETSIYKVKDELYIEIIDFSDKSKSPNKQTAFLCFPLSYIVEFFKIYSEINKSIMNTKAKDRMATKNVKKRSVIYNVNL